MLESKHISANVAVENKEGPNTATINNPDYHKASKRTAIHDEVKLDHECASSNGCPMQL